MKLELIWIAMNLMEFEEGDDPHITIVGYNSRNEFYIVRGRPVFIDDMRIRVLKTLCYFKKL